LIRKHGIDFADAAYVFPDPFALIRAGAHRDLFQGG
jgi:uncharacterized DUF497 family protein